MQIEIKSFSTIYFYILRVPMLFFFIFLCLAPTSCKNKKTGKKQSNNIADKNLQIPVSSFDTNHIVALIKEGKAFKSQNIEKASLIMKQADSLSHIWGYVEGRSNALLELVEIEAKKGHYDKALALTKQAWLYCTQAKNASELRPRNRYYRANLYSMQGNYEEAARFYKLALEELGPVLTKTNSKDIALIYANLSIVYSKLSQRDLALIYIEKAEQIALKIGNWDSYIFNNKAELLRLMGRYEEARVYYERCLEFARKYQKPAIEQYIYSGLGKVMMDKGDLDSALTYLKKGFALSNSSIGEFSNLILTGYDLGSVYFKLKEYEKAKSILVSTIRKASETGMLKSLPDACFILSEIYKVTGAYKEAYQQQQKYMQLKDSIFNSDKIRIINELETRYRTESKDRQIAEAELKNAQQETKLKNNKIIIISITSGSLLLTAIAAFLFVLYKNSRHKQRIQKQDMQVLEGKMEIQNLKSVIQGEEKERARIARELHDGVVSQLTGIQLHLSHTLQANKDHSLQSQDFHNTLINIGMATQDLRQTAHNLMPGPILKKGLVAALKSLCAAMNGINELQVDFQFYGDMPQLEIEETLSLYRIIQELLQNVVKHAQASYVLVQLNYDDSGLRFTIEDNGRGFYTANQDNVPGIGLSNIEERLRVLRGTWEIDSNSSGTGIYIHIENTTYPS